LSAAPASSPLHSSDGSIVWNRAYRPQSDSNAEPGGNRQAGRRPVFNHRPDRGGRFWRGGSNNPSWRAK
jgi:hypothetical protein